LKTTGPIKLVSALLDLPIVDREGRSCGIVDDVELSGSGGKECRIKALLVGPGAYQGRMPRWMFAIVRVIAGDRMTRIPASSDKPDNGLAALRFPFGKQVSNARDGRGLILVVRTSVTCTLSPRTARLAE